MGNDFWIVLQWWGTLFLVGAVAFPLTKVLFASWFDRGYLFSKAVGMAVVTYIVYLFGMLHLAPFTAPTIFWILIGVFVVGLMLSSRPPSRDPVFEKKDRFWVKPGMIIVLEELFFFAALFFWSWIKGHESSIHGLEKFMDYGFMQSIMNSSFFPAPDMWFTGFSINYYYFGHTVVAVLTKLSGLDLSYTFNLMLATLFALCFTMSFSIGKQLGKTVGGLLTAFLVTLAGNMQTLYAFTKGYVGDDVVPFWQLLWTRAEFFAKLPEGLERYWYANATRFIPFTIHEFPSYSFAVSDVHGHVLSIPFVLLAIGFLITMFEKKRAQIHWPFLVFYGFLVSVLLMTNALDGPIYLGLFIIILVVSNFQWKKIVPKLAIVLGAAGLASVPFLLHFKSFVSGVAVNCPPAFLAHRSIGPLLFEGVEKCQRSPFWMMYLLWGFFWFCGIWFVFNKLKETKLTQLERILGMLFVFSIGLIIFPEFFYFKDIYPTHFRSNTMFKLGYDAFILFSIVSGYVIASAIREKRKLFLLLLIPQLFLVSIYPIFSVRSYFDSLRTYKGLNGLTWIDEKYPDDYAAIMWLRDNVTMKQRNDAVSSVIIEADGDSYTDYARMSAFTGLPTVIGWPVHEWLWRGTYDVVAPRREDVRIIYESQDLEETARMLSKWAVTHVVVGDLERQKYQALFEEKFGQLGSVVFSSGQTVIYHIQIPDKILTK